MIAIGIRQTEYQEAFVLRIERGPSANVSGRTLVLRELQRDTMSFAVSIALLSLAYRVAVDAI